MEKLIQFAYVSRSTFPLTNQKEDLHPEVARILRISRRNNRGRQLAGALYFGDGNFFQCLEGDEKEVLGLYEKLKTDPRHTDLRVLRHVEIGTRTFSGWDMKYIPAEEDVQRMLQVFGLSSFDPYRFNDGMTARMIELLHAKPDGTTELAAAPAEPVTPQAAPSCSRWKFGTLAFATLFFAELVWMFAKGQ